MTKQLAFPVIDNLATGRNIELLRKQNEMSVRELQEIFGFTSPQLHHQLLIFILLHK